MDELLINLLALRVKRMLVGVAYTDEMKRGLCPYWRCGSPKVADTPRVEELLSPKVADTASGGVVTSMTVLSPRGNRPTLS